MPSDAIRIEIPGRGVMHGFANTAPEMELATIEHRMSDGSIAREFVWRTVAPPEPAPAPQQPAEAPADAGE